ncbi:MAG: hypothetical protein KF774_19040 [Planctomyces sp.]|nr:hypothetical protein [Planctomyces sp.]
MPCDIASPSRAARRTTRLLCVLTGVCALWLAATPPSGAQDAPPAPPAAEPDSDADAAATSAPHAEEESRAAEADPDDIPRLIYVPFRDLAATLGDPQSTVMVPLTEYLQLKRRGAAAVTELQGAVITRAQYRAVVEGDVASIRAELTVQVLGRPWVELPLNFGDAAIGRMQSESDQVLLRGQPDGGTVLLLGAPGAHQISLELAARVHTLPDGRQLSLSVPPVAITTFELQLPDAEQTVEIQPRQASALPAEAPGGGALVTANVGATAAISAKWYPQTSRRPAMELLASAVNEQIVSADEGLLHRDAWIRFDVLRGQLEQLRIAVPTGQRVLDVAGDARIRGWKVAEEGLRQVITVELLTAAESAVNVEVHTEGPLPSGPFPAAGLSADGTAHGIHALDVMRETGQVAIRAGSGLETAVLEQQGVSRVDAAQAPERLRLPAATIFQYFAPAFSLQVEARTLQPRLVVTHDARLVFHEEELQLTASLKYVIERAGVFELQIRLPENLSIDDVQCPAMKEFRIDDAARLLIITLAERTQGQTEVAIRARRAFSAGTDAGEQVLPLVEPLAVDRELGTVLVFASESVDVVTTETGVVGAQPVAAGAQRVRDARLTSAWSFTRRPVTIPVRTIRKPARLTAELATTIIVQPQITHVETRIDYLVEYAGLATFRLLAPEAISGQLRFEAVDDGHSIRQQTAGPAENGWVPWTIVMQRESLGRVRLKAAYDIRSAEAAAADAGEVRVSLLRPAGARAVGDVDVPLTQASGQASIQRDDSLSVTAAASGGDVEAIDVRELTLLPPTGASAFRYFRQPAEGGIEITLTRSRNDVQPVVATVVRRALIEVVAGDRSDSAVTYRCRFRIKTSERQRLLLHLPVKLELLGAFVNQRDVGLELAGLPAGQKPGEAWDAYWLNVARDTGDEEEFVVSLQFLWRLNPSLGGSGYGRGSIELPLPVIGPVESPAAVQEQRVAVWTPREFLLIGDPEGFRRIDVPDPWSRLLSRPAPRDDSALDRWFGDGAIGSLGSLPREGRNAFNYSSIGGASLLRVDWWRRTSATLFVSVAIAIIGLVLVRTTWENKLSMLLIGALALAVYAIQDLSSAVELAAAGRLGLAFLIALWVVHGLLGRRRVEAAAKPIPPAPPSPPAPADATVPPSS